MKKAKNELKKDFFNRPIFGLVIFIGFLIAFRQFDSCSWGPPSPISGVYSVSFKNRVYSLDQGRGIYITFYGDPTRFSVGGFYNSKKKFFLNDKNGLDVGDSLMKKENTDILYLKKSSGEIDTFQYNYK